MSVACATAEGHVDDVRGPCCYWKPYGSSWSMLLPAVMGKEMSFAVVLIAVDSKLRKSDIEGFRDNPHSP